MQAIPFQALVGDDGKYLANRFIIVESPGQEYSNRLRGGIEISNQQQLLVVGNPLLRNQNSEKSVPLPEAEAEAHEVAAQFRHSLLLSGKDATLQSVRHGLASAYVFHFAGHAVSGSGDPGLLLATDGTDSASSAVLGSSRVRFDKMPNLRLVVLSGCDTADSEKGLADSDGLVRVFLRAGVPQVIASKWRIDSHVSMEMMRYFYLELLRGRSAADALADSARQVRSRPATSHPYYWAAFSAFGS